MPEKQLDATQVKLRVEYWEHNADHAQMIREMVERWKLNTLMAEVDLPDHLSRGQVTHANSPFIGWITDNILADVTGYPTTATVTPVPANGTKATREELDLADTIERAANLLLQELNPAKTNEWGMRWHQLNSPYVTPILKVERDEDGKLCFRLELPSPETCFFPIDVAPARPKELARRYKALVRDITKTYSNRKFNPGKKPVTNSEGNWHWEEIGEDVAVSSSTAVGAGGGSDVNAECEMLVLYTDDYCYHVALNKGPQGGGEVVWSERNYTGGVPSVIIPGRVTELRGADRWWPMLYPIYQMIKLINRVRAKRETRSDQAKTDVLVGKTPDHIRAEAEAAASLQAAGIDKQQQATLAQGAPSLIDVPGDPKPWPLAEDRDLDMLEQSYWNELKIYAESIKENASSEEMAQATANAYLSWSDQKKKQQAPMLDHYAFGMAEILRMCFKAMEEFDEELQLTAKSDIEYGSDKKIGTGEMISLKPEDLSKIKWLLKVETKSMTDTDIRMRVQDWAQRNSLGISTKREGLEAAGYSDVQAQLQALAEERAQDFATPQIEQQAQLVIQERIRLRGRTLIQIGGPQQAQQIGNPNSFDRMPAPALAPGGGSSVPAQGVPA